MVAGLALSIPERGRIFSPLFSRFRPRLSKFCLIVDHLKIAIELHGYARCVRLKNGRTRKKESDTIWRSSTARIFSSDRLSVGLKSASRRDEDLKPELHEITGQSKLQARLKLQASPSIDKSRWDTRRRKKERNQVASVMTSNVKRQTP